MADKKISELVQINIGDLVDEDEFVIADASASDNKSITWGEMTQSDPLDDTSGRVALVGMGGLLRNTQPIDDWDTHEKNQRTNLYYQTVSGTANNPFDNWMSLLSFKRLDDRVGFLGVKTVDNPAAQIGLWDGTDTVVEDIWHTGNLTPQKICVFATRAELVSENTAGAFDSIEDGAVVFADGLAYKRSAGATDIPDLAGWVPAGDATGHHFGCVGDSTADDTGTDDTTAIQSALNWWAGANHRNLTFLGDGRVYRIAAPSSGTKAIEVDCDKAYLGTLRFDGPIRPDTAAFDAISFYDGRLARFHLCVDGGGQTADYTQPDPTGSAQAFVFQSIQESDFWVIAEGYKGRVLRVSQNVSGGLKTSKNTFYSLRSGDITDPGGERPCGQAFYFDSQTSAFGTIVSSYTFWDDYGWVIEDCGDVLLGQMENGTNENSGPELRGVFSVWANTMTNGDNTGTIDLFTFKDSAVTGNSCYNISVGHVFVTGGKNGVVVENVGDGTRNGIAIGAIKGRSQAGWTLKVDNCRNPKIYVDSRLSEGSVKIDGATKGANVEIDDSGSNGTALDVTATVGADNRLSGYIKNGNRDNTADTPLISIQTTELTSLDGLVCQSDQVNYIGDFASGNSIRWTGGRVSLSDGTAIFSSAPEYAVSVSGYKTFAAGIATIPSGSNNVDVSHGLAGEPLSVSVAGRSSNEVSSLRIDSPGPSTFRIVAVDGAVTADREIMWSAFTGAYVA